MNTSSHLLPNYQRRNLEFVNGSGSYLVDETGREYLDLTSGIGVNNLGYRSEKIVVAVKNQLDLIWHSPNLYQSSLQEKVAAQLCAGTDYLSYFCNSGTEANEAALKLIRKASGKTKIITFDNSFHGRTYGSMSATAQAKIQTGFGPLVPNFVYVPYNDIVAFKAAIDADTAGVLLEIVQGEGGVKPAELSWLQELAAICQETEIILAVDEIQTGIGRTGTFYAWEQYGIQPDIVTLAKALGNGLPVGAMLAKEKFASAFGPGSHGSTFGGNRLALVAASVVIEEINQPSFLANVQQKGDFLLNELRQAIAHLPQVADIRGLGLMVGIELNSDPAPIVTALEAQGVVVLTAGERVLRLLPPLTITESELAIGVAKIKAVLEKEGA